MRGAGWRIAAAIVLALVVAEHRAVADEAVELRYTAPPECPARDAVLAQVRERTAVTFAVGARRLFEITIVATSGGYSGTLVVDSNADKQLAAERCDDLTTALALVTALAIDPAAGAVKPLPAPSPAPPPTSIATSRSWHADGAIGVAIDAGITPGAMFAGALAGRLAWPRLAIDLAVVVGHDTAAAGDGTAEFTWLAARPAVCVTPIARAIELAGCVDLEIGVVRAGGADIINGRDLTRLWLATGVSAGARWPVSSRGFAQLQIGLAVPLLRDRYRFMPDVLVHETSVVTAWFAAGVGLRFR